MKKLLTSVAFVAIAAITVSFASCSKADKAETEANASENLENVPLDAAVDVAAETVNVADVTTPEPVAVEEPAAEVPVAEKVANEAKKVAAVAEQVVKHETFTAETIRPDSKVGRVTVLDFNAVWCVPCKALTPVFKAAEKTFNGQIDFLEIDIDKYQATAEAFGVKNVPTVVVMRPDGKNKTYVGTGDLLPAEKFNKILTEALK